MRDHGNFSWSPFSKYNKVHSIISSFTIHDMYVCHNLQMLIFSAHHFIPIPIIQSFHGICCLTGPAIGGMLSVGL